jgi:hypothetical protein
MAKIESLEITSAPCGFVEGVLAVKQKSCELEHHRV